MLPRHHKTQDTFSAATSLEDLRKAIGKLERRLPPNREQKATYPILSMGDHRLDRLLPWNGLPLCGLHEIISGFHERDEGAAAGFCTALLARLFDASPQGSPVLWCQRAHQRGQELYGPGLAALGLAPDRLIVFRARTDTDILWALEEGLRSGGLGAVLGEVSTIDLTASRRLQLAAEKNAVMALLLRPPGTTRSPNSALTRWRISAHVAVGDNYHPRWSVELLRCRGGLTQNDGLSGNQKWLVDWHHETGRFAVVSDLSDGSVRKTKSPQTEPNRHDVAPLSLHRTG